jgi:hypothetical protein
MWIRKKKRKHYSTAAQPFKEIVEKKTPSSHTWKPTKSMGPAF